MHTSYLWVEVLINCCLAIFSPSPWQRSLRASSHLYFLQKVSRTASLFLLRLVLASTVDLAPQQLISFTATQIGRICFWHLSRKQIGKPVVVSRRLKQKVAFQRPLCSFLLVSWLCESLVPSHLKNLKASWKISSQSKPTGNHGPEL